MKATFQYPVRLMAVSDVSPVVDIHLKAFQGFFLTFLGEPFLRELYIGILNDPSGIAFVNEMDGDIFGFVAGTDSPQGFYKQLLRQRWWRFGWASILPAIKNPRAIPRLLRAFSRSQDIDVRENCAMLMSIAVSPDIARKGIGVSLVNAFLVEAKDRGVKQVNLTTDKQNNTAVNRFYQKQGFALHTSYVTPEGREMNEYLIDLE
jgi:GNAT superfamily N-acetyltransferase